MRAATLVWSLAMLPGVCYSQTLSELRGLFTPASLELSSDGSLLWYKLGQDRWVVGTAPNSKPKRAQAHQPATADQPLEVHGTPRLTSPRSSPDGKRVAYIDAEKRYGPGFLYCLCEGSEHGNPRRISQIPVLAFQWAGNSHAVWIVASDGADQPIGLLSLDGRFQRMSQGAAMRVFGGLAAANDVIAWVQSDGSHHGTIWVINHAGTPYMLFDPNPQTSRWSEAWTQEVVRWKNAQGEELQGILATPRGSGPFPLIVDPYSSWQNRFLNIPLLGNYMFVKAGFAVFFPDHRAPHTFPEWAFGESYVGGSLDRDPVDVLTDDVMTGVSELIRRGIADERRLFLYSTSNGASAIDQLLTQTHAFRAAVSHGGVADWLSYYRSNHSRGDETIPGFLGGRRPEDSPALYRRISPFYNAEKIVTPLLLVVGQKDSIPNGGSRYADARAFAEELRRVGSPVEFVVYPGEDHGISAAMAEEHVRKALEFFRAAGPPKQ